MRRDIVEIIKDSVKIVEDDSISEQMRECINQIKLEMEDNLTHLDNGGKIDELPTKIENHVLESEIELQVEITQALENENKEQSNNETKTTKNKTVESNKQKLSLWQVFKLWLSSPWNVSWNSLKETSSKKRTKR